MSLKPEPIGSIPEETMRVAKAAFPQGNIFMKMRDEIGIHNLRRRVCPSLRKRRSTSRGPVATCSGDHYAMC
jgi:hypothetical protein